MPSREIPLYRITGDPTLTPGVSGDDSFSQAPARTGGSLGLGRNPISLNVLPRLVPDSDKPSGPNPPSYVNNVGGCDNNMAPICVAENANLTWETIRYFDVTGLCMDPEGHRFTLVDAVVDVGTVELSRTVIEYTPLSGYVGPAVIRYTVRDACGATEVGLINLSILCASVVEHAALDTLLVSADTFTCIPLGMVLTPGDTGAGWDGPWAMSRTFIGIISEDSFQTDALLAAPSIGGTGWDGAWASDDCFQRIIAQHDFENVEPSDAPSGGGQGWNGDWNARTGVIP